MAMKKRKLFATRALQDLLSIVEVNAQIVLLLGFGLLIVLIDAIFPLGPHDLGLAVKMWRLSAITALLQEWGERVYDDGPGAVLATKTQTLAVTERQDEVALLGLRRPIVEKSFHFCRSVAFILLRHSSNCLLLFRCPRDLEQLCESNALSEATALGHGRRSASRFPLQWLVGRPV